MKQVIYTNGKIENLDRKVNENYNELTENQILQVISYMWKKHIEMFGFTPKQIYNAYKKLGISVDSIVQFEYFPKDTPLKGIVLIKEDVAYNVPKKRKDLCLLSQYIAPYSYFNVSANKVFEKLFFDKYPELDKEPFVWYETKSVNIEDLLNKKISDILEFKELTLREIIKILTKKDEISNYLNQEIKRRNIHTYFDSDLIFLSYRAKDNIHRTITYNIKIESFVNGNIDKIIEYDEISNQYFLNSLSKGDLQYRQNNEIIKSFFEFVLYLCKVIKKQQH